MFRLEIDTENAAFNDGTMYDTMKELIDILEKAKVQLLTGRMSASLSDVNGNTVGSWVWTHETHMHSVDLNN